MKERLRFKRKENRQSLRDTPSLHTVGLPTAENSARSMQFVDSRFHNSRRKGSYRRRFYLTFPAILLLLSLAPLQKIMARSSSIGEDGREMALEAVRFEVFGRVQGVFFRAHTEEQAKQLGLVGWCMNTPEGTVTGEIQGPSDKMKQMLHWLRHVGSPMSKIEKLEIREKNEIPKLTFQGFEIRRKKK